MAEAEDEFTAYKNARKRLLLTKAAEEARKCETMSEFKKRFPTSHEYARRHHALRQITSHMARPYAQKPPTPPRVIVQPPFGECLLQTFWTTAYPWADHTNRLRGDG